MGRQGSGTGRGAQSRASGAAYADGNVYQRDLYTTGAFPVDPGYQGYADGTEPRPADLPPGPPRSRPERGMITVKSETKNQNGEIVQVLTSRMLVWRRPA